MTDETPGEQEPLQRDDPVKAHVERWLQVKGVRLELAVAAEFRRHLGARWVEHARYYVSDHGGERKVREVDVVAQVRGTFPRTTAGLVTTWFIVECKSSKSNPWVLYRTTTTSMSQFVGKDERGLLRETIRWIERGASVDHLSGWDVSDAYFSMYTEGQYAYHVADTGEEPGKSSSKRAAYEAVQQVLSAVDGAAAEVLEDSNSPELSIFVPVVVTSAPLYTVDTEGDGYPVARASIVPLVGRFTTDSLSLVWIVQEDALADYVTRAVNGARKLRL